VLSVAYTVVLFIAVSKEGATAVSIVGQLDILGFIQLDFIFISNCEWLARHAL